MRIKANALFIVIILSLVMGLICSSLVLMAYYSRKQITDNFIREKLITNAESGLNLLFANTDDHYTTPQTVDLYDQGTDSVVIVKKNWGIFEIANVKAMFKNHTCTKSVLLGYKPDNVGNAAIWLTDNNKALYVGGKTTITGTSFLPERKVDVAPDKPFFGRKPDPSTVKISEKTIPPLNEKIKSEIQSSLQDSFTNTRQLDFRTAFKDSTVISNSFSQQTLILSDQQNSLSIRKKISGNIIISTRGNVIIKANAILKDIQVYANSIVVESGFSGTLQLFASDSIVINNDVKLCYPSVLCLLKTDANVMIPFISLEPGSFVSGVIITDQSITDNTKTKLIIKSALLKGQAYVNGKAEIIKGKIYGNIICDLFNYDNNDNYLIDAEIDRTKLPNTFVGSAIISSKRKKDVIKWFHLSE